MIRRYEVAIATTPAITLTVSAGSRSEAKQAVQGRAFGLGLGLLPWPRLRARPIGPARLSEPDWIIPGEWVAFAFVGTRVRVLVGRDCAGEAPGDGPALWLRGRVIRLLGERVPPSRVTRRVDGVVVRLDAGLEVCCFNLSAISLQEVPDA